MINKKQNRFLSFFAFLMAFLSMLTGLTPARSEDIESASVKSEPTPVPTYNEKKESSYKEDLAFKRGIITSVLWAAEAVALYFPAKAACSVCLYSASEYHKKKAFIKDFGEQKAEIVEKQQGADWDWAACLVSIVKNKVSDSKISQCSFVKKVTGGTAFFKHNRTEHLPTTCYYNIWLRSALNDAVKDYQVTDSSKGASQDKPEQNKCSDNILHFERKLHEFPDKPDTNDIKNTIITFYQNVAQNGIFAISDSYFYGESPYTHFVLVTKIENGQITVEDPATGLKRTHDISEFCKGYLNEDGTPKLASFEMFTYVSTGHSTDNTNRTRSYSI